MIYKTLWGMHIDLSKLVAVSDIFQYGGGFEIQFQLMDKPILIDWGTEEDISAWHKDLLEKWKQTNAQAPFVPIEDLPE